jgi:hypothetical protein
VRPAGAGPAVGGVVPRSPRLWRPASGPGRSGRGSVGRAWKPGCAPP